MRKSYITYITYALVALITSGCNGSLLDEEEQGGISGIKQETLSVVMTLAPAYNSGETRYLSAPSNMEEISSAECALKQEELYIGTYEPDGTLIEKIYDGPNGAASGVDFWVHTTFGPQITVNLERSNQKYQKDFYIAAFAAPGANTDFLSNITIPANITFSHPSNGSKWEPSVDTNMANARFSMAGCLLLSKRWLDKVYNPENYGPSLLALPPIRLVRSMAKIVIKDPEGIIKKAEIRHRKTGIILPKANSSDNNSDNKWWISLETDDNTYDWKTMTPNATTGKTSSDFITQTYEIDEPEKENVIVFYAYESDFAGLGNQGTEEFDENGTTDTRAMIRLTAGGQYSSLPAKTIHITPYEGGKVADLNATEIAEREDGYMWSGLLRNHCYTFTIQPPSNGQLQIYVKATKWEYQRNTFDF